MQLSTWPERVGAELVWGMQYITQIHPYLLDPRLRIGTPTGEYYLSLTLTNSPRLQQHRLRLLKDFLVWKQATSFIWVSQTVAPDSVVSVGLSGKQTYGVRSLMVQPPLTFGRPQLIAPGEIDDAFRSFLPDGSSALTATRIKLLQHWFGPEGTFPAVLV